MSIVTIFSGAYCESEEISSRVAQRLGYRLIADGEAFDFVEQRFRLPREKVERAMYGQLSVFSKFTRDRERCVTYLREAIAELVADDRIVHYGFAGHLLPRSLAHILRVCIVAGREHRVAHAVAIAGWSKSRAQREIRKGDLVRAEWTKYLHGRGPWDRRLYDIKIPTHTIAPEEAVELICDAAQAPPVRSTDASAKATRDFLTAAKVNSALAEQGYHDVDVSSRDGEVTITTKRYVLRLDHLRKQFSEIAGKIPGVRRVQTREGQDVQAGYLMSRQEFDLPAKVLLVDDEKEFVQTLSERLQMRDVGTATVYNGEEALSLLETEEPEVMILDLRMPGIDGIEVLRQVKRLRPQVEVIILTGHGTAKDEALARELGAFAYLEKPVDIDRLTRTLKEAYQKIKQDREAGAG